MNYWDFKGYTKKVNKSDSLDFCICNQTIKLEPTKKYLSLTSTEFIIVGMEVCIEVHIQYHTLLITLCP